MASSEDMRHVLNNTPSERATAPGSWQHWQTYVTEFAIVAKKEQKRQELQKA
jgi:NADH:ubiquinone oxidoreductase subunit